MSRKRLTETEAEYRFYWLSRIAGQELVACQTQAVYEENFVPVAEKLREISRVASEVALYVEGKLTSERCHCGKPVYLHPEVTPSDGKPFTRGLCETCDEERCDAPIEGAIYSCQKGSKKS